jgi:hypothetical protein
VRNFNFRKEDEDRLEKVVFVLDQEKASYISVSARILLHKRRGNVRLMVDCKLMCVRKIALAAMAS